MMLRKLKSARAGLGALLLALAFAGAATAAHADHPVPAGTVSADPAPATTPRTEPAPVASAPAELANPVASPSASDLGPSVPAESAFPGAGTFELPIAETPEELAPAAESPAAVVVAPPALGLVPQGPVAEPTDGEASEEAAPETPSHSAALEPAQSTAPAIIAPPSEPPLAAAAEIQAAAALTRGSPPVVQLFAVLGLLAAGFAYFRFLDGPRLSARAGK
jgi:hypothetical protein